MGAAVPKQYLQLDGAPIVVRTLRQFEAAPMIGEVLLVVPPADRIAAAKLVAEWGLAKVRAVLAGGQRRQDSVRVGVDALRAEDEIVVVHDGVRPLVELTLIAAVVEEAQRAGAAAAGVPIGDTVKSVSEGGLVVRTVAREGLWLTQTPQAFRREVLQEAHWRAAADGFTGQDDAVLVERIGAKVRMVRGTVRNIKITTPEDMELARALLAVVTTKVPSQGQGDQ